MKYLVLAISALFVVSGAAAQSLGNPGTTPGDAFYGLDRAAESVSMALTFSKEAKAEKSMNFARERLAEANELRERNRTELANRSLEQYRNHVQRARNTGESISDQERQQRVQEKISNASMEHAEALNRERVVRGNPLYRAKTQAEETAVELEQDPVRKAEKRLKALEHRMNETEILAERNQTREMNRTLQHYMEGLEELERAGNATDNQTRMQIQERVANATQKHIQVLERVRGQVPEQARQGIDTALNRSRQGHQTAVDAFERAGGSETKFGPTERPNTGTGMSAP